MKHSYESLVRKWRDLRTRNQYKFPFKNKYIDSFKSFVLNEILISD